MSEFVIFTGPMFGGKTTRLLSSIERFRLRQKRVYIFKPLKDTRYDPKGIAIISHTGYETLSIPIEKPEDINEYLEKRASPVGIIAVDEAFMIEGIADTLIDLYKKGFSILISSLQLSSQGEPFEEITKMLPWATRVEVCPAVCTICGADAFYTYKKRGTDKQLEIGGGEMYEPRCLNHWNHDMRIQI